MAHAEESVGKGVEHTRVCQCVEGSKLLAACCLWAAVAFFACGQRALIVHDTKRPLAVGTVQEQGLNQAILAQVQIKMPSLHVEGWRKETERVSTKNFTVFSSKLRLRSIVSF